jgi:hypothetical protein
MIKNNPLMTTVTSLLAGALLASPLAALEIRDQDIALAAASASWQYTLEYSDFLKNPGKAERIARDAESLKGLEILARPAVGDGEAFITMKDGATEGELVLLFDFTPSRYQIETVVLQDYITLFPQQTTHTIKTEWSADGKNWHSINTFKSLPEEIRGNRAKRPEIKLKEPARRFFYRAVFSSEAPHSFGPALQWARSIKGAKEKSFDIRFALSPVPKGNAQFQLLRGLPSKTIKEDAVFYPVFPRRFREASPAIRLERLLTGDQSRPLSEKETDKLPGLGSESYITWDADGLYLDIAVKDPTPGQTLDGSGMWRGDSVQVGIDRHPEDTQKPRNAFFELGFAWTAQGVDKTVWHTDYPEGPSFENTFKGNFDWRQAKLAGRATRDGYAINTFLTWKSLGIDPAAIPDALGINLLVNFKESPDSPRYYTALARGIGDIKNVSFFVHSRIIKASSLDVSLLNEKDGFDAGEKIAGNFFFTAPAGAAAENFVFTAQEVTDSSPAGVVLGEIPVPALKAGETLQMPFRFPARTLREGKYALVLRDQRGRLAEARSIIERSDFTTERRQLLASVKPHWEELSASIRQTGNAGADGEIRLGKYILDRFIPQIETHSGMVDEYEELLQLREMREVLEKLDKRLAEIRKTGVIHTVKFPGEAVRISMKDGLFRVADESGERPFFFYGYGHFGSVARDIPIMNSLGASLIQNEWGPNQLSPNGAFAERARKAGALLASAPGNGVRVDVLLSPHYMPQWAFDKGGDMKLNDRAWGFLKYNINHPVAREVLGNWMDRFLPGIAKNAGVFSICLANEPAFFASGTDPYSRPAWVSFLAARHSGIDKLNQLYGTSWKKFEDVPVPPIGHPGELVKKRRVYDWTIFNVQNFSQWFEWLHAKSKQAAPDVPTHVKIMMLLFDSGCETGIDPELISNITDIAGNDNGMGYRRTGRYALGWERVSAWYDLLHSFKGQPVFNSETHFGGNNQAKDRMSSEFPYTPLWLMALRHVGASTQWVWEDPVHEDLAGSIYTRPLSIFSSGRALLDINRFARELELFNAKKAEVAILYSPTSIFWNENYSAAILELYATLVLSGTKVTFLSERQLEKSAFSPANEAISVLLAPHVSHIPDASVRGLARLQAKGIHIATFGEDAFAFDEYARKRESLPGIAEASFAAIPPDRETLGGLLTGLLEKFQVKTLSLRDVETGVQSLDMEYREVNQDGRHLFILINLANRTRVVALQSPGEATDLLTGEAVDLSKISMDSLQVRLLETTGQPVNN